MKKIIKSIMCTLLLLIFSTFTANANAAVFKCLSVTGETFYTDKPCEVGSKETEIKVIITPKAQSEVDDEDNEETELFEG